ncbi:MULTISPECIES: lysophospholipid acyltransferase family protein [Rubrivivax]|uniref:Lysophospholipid acyltransferase family protein n=1 Tax=Rubrivivax benzoatilyticus TaxID=316997 RepID=A0ABX0HWG5_9BURK|nr:MULTISPECIES: lysophospholipid acyltransferase family protein [Rubrivivax]MCD0423291.1 lysophospholipid acyltransferase family protein [Rubrivivax sp. JA1024]EGJ12192.1 putative acyltransferase [Rubrivivax benzoatilyticus JA2 = ATCC BAA-35]MCC9596418.1 lysophospholipid acyltransferase family protein [Rubrivivax sp. JA1055]MCC9647238.1 lysophospholipid acyltransferase family protein [Rubrivivax sp. JA1029]NHK99337.1 lysophospholipid acyltransferase family protein [Rubrivivax benzoatilyticus]
MFFLVRWLSRRSLRFLHVLGAFLGWLVYWASPSYRRRLDANAALAGLTAAERREAVADAGRLVMEVPRLWLRPREQPIADPVRWEGAELMESLLGRGKGLVLLTPHMGSFEIAAQAYAERFGARQPLTVLYRPARKQLLRELEETARARPALATAPATLAGVRQMLRALKKGETVGLLPDQVPPEGQGVWAPFFGQPAYTMTLAARLVQQTGAAVAILWAERLPRGAGYVVRLMPMPVPLPEDGGDEAGAIAVNRSMEAVIRLKPTQYLWGYHRYKAPRSGASS